MGPSSGQPQIFNPKLRTLRRERAMRRDRSFLLERCAVDAAERLMDINRRFEHAIIIGLPVFERVFLESLPDHKKPKVITSFTDWPQSFPNDVHPDLVVSALVLQSLDQVPQALSAARMILVPDGLCLSAIVGGESLLALRRACFAVDQKRYGGIIPRVAPMIDVHQAAKLLQATGFALPVIDRDGFMIKYKALKTLICDLRDIGETNCLVASQRRFEGRAFLESLAQNYPEIDTEGRFEITFEVLWITGWKPHENQQKPLKPGSAKKRLSDALKSIRDEKI